MALATRQTIPPAVPDREEIKARIAALPPLARDTALENEREGRIADAVIEAYKASGIHRVPSPGVTAAGNAATKRWSI